MTDAMRATLPPVTHPLVRTMPYGRRSPHIGGHAVGIVGWPEAEALALLETDRYAREMRRTTINECGPETSAGAGA